MNRSPEHWLEFHWAYFGPLHAAFGQLDTSGQQRLAIEVLDWLNFFSRGARVSPHSRKELR